MEQNNIVLNDANNETPYIEFDSVPVPKSPIGVFSKENLIIFFRPLFKKLPKKEAAYWTILSFVAFSFMGAIMLFIDSYVKDINDYQSSMSSVGKYHSVYQALEDEAKPFQPPEKK
ncbi:MAG: hypothetical protein WCT49_02645 [Candidatus Paceibacterota bacterium]|jgi:hypothetical protein|nr:hypothetical protein [Candidatus Paceibacterota bacterium]